MYLIHSSYISDRGITTVGEAVPRWIFESYPSHAIVAGESQAIPCGGVDTNLLQ